METPSQEFKKEDSQPITALIDITNDSPIVGLAVKSILSEKTPTSFVVKSQVQVKNTPGSGEALLRDQVKSLLQIVEEDDEFVHNDNVLSGQVCPVKLLAPIQVAEAVNPVPECVISRALLFDSPDKSVGSNSSLTISSSCWSLQVNVSAQSEDYEEACEYLQGEFGETFDDLCEGLSRMTVNGDGKKGLPEFIGKHTKFVYDSDDEIKGEEIIKENNVRSSMTVSPSVVILNGLPMPEGKHLRFNDEEED